jgi:hypothetical protein
MTALTAVLQLPGPEAIVLKRFLSEEEATLRHAKIAP